MSRLVPPSIWQVESFAHCLSLRDLASLSCAQKEWQPAIVALYSSPRASQLVQALEASLPGLNKQLTKQELASEYLSAPSDSDLLGQLRIVVSYLQASHFAPWGPSIAAAPGLLEDVTQLFTVPQLPYTVGYRFVKHLELRISYKQLLLAAYKQVAGVELWVRAQLALGIPAHLPDAVLALCRLEKDVLLVKLRSQSPQERADILQLALNSRYSSIAEAVAAEVLPAIADPAKLTHLLHTAVVRGHCAVVQSIAATPAAQQLTPSAVLQVMQAAQKTADGSAGAPLHSLVKLPAAATLSTDDLVPLLQSAVAVRCEKSINALCTLPAAQELPSDHLRDVLSQIIGHRISNAVRALCSLSAAAKLTVDDVMALLWKVAVKAGDRDIDTLCIIPAAQHLPLDFYSSLMKRAIEDHSEQSVAALCSLQAAMQVDTGLWVELATFSLSVLPDRKTVILCGMPAARQLSSADLLGVLRPALQRLRSAAVEALCQLPAAQDINPQDVIRLVQQLNCGPQGTVFWECFGKEDKLISNILKQLAALNAVQHMNAADFCVLIGILVKLERCDEATLQMWYKCHAAHRMPADILAQHMQDAIQQDQVEYLRALCQTPAAARMHDVGIFLQLINEVMGLDSEDCVHMLEELVLALPAARKLSSKQLGDLLAALLEAEIPLVSGLCDLPAASLLPAAKVVDLLAIAIEKQNEGDVESLCSFQVASHLHSDVIQELLLAAVEANNTAMLTALCALPGAAEVSCVELLLDKALRNYQGDVVKGLCQLPSATDISTGALIRYLDRATRLGNGVAVRCLCQLPNAHCIQKQKVTQFLRTATGNNSYSGIPALCQLRAAHRIPVKTLLQLIERTAKLQYCHAGGATLALVQLMKRVMRAKTYFYKPS